MTGRLAGKTAIVTGAGSGQGRAATVLFAAEGARVLACDIDGDAVKQLADEVGDAVLGVECDVSSSEAVQATVKLAQEHLGGLSVLVNSAGVDLAGGLGDGPAADLDEEIFDRTLGVNLRGTYLMVKYSLPLLRRDGGGSIINIASISGVVLGSSQHAYATSKGGVVAFTRALALSYAPENVRANVIVPGIIRTPMIDFILKDEALSKRYIEGTPLGRIGEPSEIGHLAVYLASDESGFMTGAAITIDGGLTLQ